MTDTVKMFKALGDENRLFIFRMISKEEICACRATGCKCKCKDGCC